MITEQFRDRYDVFFGDPFVSRRIARESYSFS